MKPRPFRTHCHRGHELTAANVKHYRRQDGTQERQCRQCIAARNRTSHAVGVRGNFGTVDLAAIRQIPPDPQDIADFNRPPWERHPIPWDNVAPLD